MSCLLKLGEFLKSAVTERRLEAAVRGMSGHGFGFQISTLACFSRGIARKRFGVRSVNKATSRITSGASSEENAAPTAASSRKRHSQTAKVPSASSAGKNARALSSPYFSHKYITKERCWLLGELHGHSDRKQNRDKSRKSEQGCYQQTCTPTPSTEGKAKPTPIGG